VNVLPLRAQAYVNHRIHPMDTIAKVVERDRRIINDDRVKLRPTGSIEPSPVSDHNSPSFHALHETVIPQTSNHIIYDGKLMLAMFPMSF
jgi:acetylornithine deacetylase/succinyl-diaminopimelate desuccinylase-like protein